MVALAKELYRGTLERSGGITMPRAKKDGQHINCYIDRTLCERLKAYADEKGQTMTMALERILKQYFESENKEAIDKDDMEALR